jgi:hypothetical protein
MYLWVLGEEVETDAVVGIEQIVAKPTDSKPLLRIASHRCRVSADFQLDLFGRLKNMWNAIQSEYVFDNLSIDESREKQAVLNKVHEGFQDEPENENEEWWNENMREA